ncbi:13732_t:CDS:2 [Dentiscutata erythropus]|uniref:13732_t:CDS:1 n=1 Tax=Dentiscutata erythropus TaxID=1348616 RepID=A0A9N9HHI5_9GLOM|nr:13732_t:CDS:2 [Dentiscutata erythropus]
MAPVLGVESEITRSPSLSISIAATDRILLPAKWFQESISTVDEFLLSVHNKIHLVTKDNTIMPSDYFMTFKTQRKTGASTQLVNEQDFIKFKLEYTKLATRKSDIGIYVTISQPSITISQNKQKKKESDLNEHEKNTEQSNNYKNNNRVPSVSSLSVYDKEIAKNMLTIRNAYYLMCIIIPTLIKKITKICILRLYL